MKLEKFINETVTINGRNYREKDVDGFLDFWGKLQKECKPFLDELKRNNKSGSLMYRGEKDKGPFHIKKPRTDRTPKDMPQEWHEAFDEWFNDNMGWRARSSGLFCTGKLSIASGYSSTRYIIFPAGRYEYTWSPTIPDLYNEVESGDIYNYIKPDESLLKELEDRWEEEYGEGSGNGDWEYDGILYGYKYDEKEYAVKGITEELTEELIREKIELKDVLDKGDEDEIEEYGSYQTETGKEYIYSRIEDIENEIEDIERSVEREITWVPSTDKEDFIEDATYNMTEFSEDFNDETYYNAVDDYCEGKYYDSVNLLEALQSFSGNEIMFKCKKYYAVHQNLQELIEYVLWINTENPEQLKLFFDDKKGRR